MKTLTRFFSGTRNVNPNLEPESDRSGETSGGGETTAPVVPAAPSGDREMIPGADDAENGETPPPTTSTEAGWRTLLMEKPPADDVCPICFGNFEVPCRAPCGHWYCGSCILQYWNFGAALQPCKCPMCSTPITKLMPEASLYHRREMEICKALQNVGDYNRLFVGGISGFMLKIQCAVSLYIKRKFHEMLNGERPFLVVSDLRTIAIILGSLYSLCPFDFLRIGRENIFRVFDYGAIALSFILPLVGLYLRRRRERNVRELAEMQQEQD